MIRFFTDQKIPATLETCLTNVAQNIISIKSKTWGTHFSYKVCYFSNYFPRKFVDLPVQCKERSQTEIGK